MARKKNNRRGRKPNDKNMRRDVEIRNTAQREFEADSRERRDYAKGGMNDPAWYAQNAQLMRDYASYPFGIPLGNLHQTGIGTIDKQSVPGVCALYYTPEVGGYNLDPNSPVNIAARNIYSFVRHANSGHSNYDSPDLMIYLLAMDSAYMYHEFLKRLLGVLLAYTPVNRYYPAALVAAMSVDFTDIQKHITDLRGYINQYAVKLGSMCVPNSMSYFARHQWMTRGLYTDSNSSKAQTYMYVPGEYMQLYIATDVSAGEPVSSIKWVNWMDTLHTFDSIVAFGNSLINPILSNEDMNIMSGDILKAFGPEGIIKIMGVPDGYIVLPEYNQEVLSQIENATIFRTLTDYDAKILTQTTAVGTGYLAFKTPGGMVYDLIEVPNVFPSSQYNSLATLYYRVADSKRILNFHHDSVTAEETMVATRLTEVHTKLANPVKVGTAIRIPCDIPTLGSERLIRMRIYRYANPSGVKELSYRAPYTMEVQVLASNSAAPLTNATIASTMVKIATTMAEIDMFDWHPAVYNGYFLDTTEGFSSGVVDAIELDFDFYTTIDKDNLINMSTAALLSQFTVPQMGAFSTKI